MYKAESYSDVALNRAASELAEKGEKADSAVESLNIYLNSKPGTWRLISHAIGSHPEGLNVHYFIWATGD